MRSMRDLMVKRGGLDVPVLLPVAITGFSVVGLSAASSGGSLAAWRIGALLFLVVAAAIHRWCSPQIGRWGTRLICAGLLLAAYSALSATWSVDPTATFSEVQRWVMLTAATTCFVMAARAWPPLFSIAGVAAGSTIVCTYGLATRLLPDWFGEAELSGINRLSQPVGYWNGLASLAVVGIVLCAGFAARGGARARAASAAATVPLALALYLTFSRGALLALAAGIAVMVVLDRNRLEHVLRAICVVPGAVSIVVVVQGFPALRSAFPDISDQVSQGRQAAVALAIVIAASAELARRWPGVIGRLPVSGDARKMAVVALSSLGLAVGVGMVISAGGPGALMRLAGTGAQASPRSAGGDLNMRLLSLSENGRDEIWRVAWRNFTEHPVLGSGDGSFVHVWTAKDREPLHGRAAHSVFLETATELGLVGLALLLAFLGLPLAGVRPARTAPLGPAVVGALLAVLLQASFDWTWDVPAVTVVTLVCMSCLAARADVADGITRSALPSGSRRPA